MIEDFVCDVCEILNIDAPAVSYDTKDFPTSTMMAQCSPDGSVIFVKECKKPNPDQLFSIAHELRHVCQMQDDPERYLSVYKPLTCAHHLKNTTCRLLRLMQMPLQV